METTVKALIFAALASVTLASTADVASAQYGDVVPMGRNWRGEPVCPSNYVVRGNACVSIYALGRGGYGDRYPGYRRDYYRDDGRRQYYDEYDHPRPRGRAAVQPWINPHGELQCPSNYVIRGGVCVSLY